MAVEFSAQLTRKGVTQWKIERLGRIKVPHGMRCFACHDLGHMAARCTIDKTGKISVISVGEEHSFKLCKASCVGIDYLQPPYPIQRSRQVVGSIRRRSPGAFPWGHRWSTR